MDDINYLVLVSLAEKTRKTADKLTANLTRATQNKGKLLWFDAAYIGYIAPYPRAALQLWDEVIDGINDKTALRDMLIVELGRDWAGRPDTPATNWLMPHLGHSLPPIR